jgi:hypothetical protein
MNPGFYKVDPGGELLYAPNNVFGPDYNLSASDDEEYTYPVDGWYWFDSEEEARLALNMPLPQE